MVSRAVGVLWVKRQTGTHQFRAVRERGGGEGRGEKGGGGSVGAWEGQNGDARWEGKGERGKGGRT